jgi:hypothetical protein
MYPYFVSELKDHIVIALQSGFKHNVSFYVVACAK